MSKKLMILGASELQLPAIECASRLGLETVVLDYDSEAVGKKRASKFYEVSTLDYQKISEVAKTEKIDGLMTICSDRPMPIIAKVGEKLKLNTIAYDTAMKATDKGLMRLTLRQNNVPIPKFFICKTYDDFVHAVRCINGKCIVKPSNNSGSRGIHIYENGDGKEIYEYSKKYSTDKIVLVEEFMSGPEVSVEIFVINGGVNIVQITDKITTGEPYFVEMGHTQPSSLPSDVQEDIKSVAEQGVKALGICNGPAHVEIKVTDTGAKIVEIGARLGGDHIATDLVSLSTGINMVELVINYSLNIPIHLKKVFSKSSAIRYFNEKIEIPDSLKETVMYHYNEQIKVSSIKSSNDRRGYYIIQANNIVELNEKLEEIERFNEKR